MEENKVTEGQVETETPKTYTQEEVDTLLQQETDRRVTSALKKQEYKNEQAVREAEKLARMNEAEKYQYQLEQREKAIAEKERALALAENKNAASSILADKGLSLALVDFVVAEDADTMKQNIDKLDKAFKASVKAEVEKRLASTTPKKNLPTEQALTREKVKSMNVAELQDLYTNNPELFKALVSK